MTMAHASQTHELGFLLDFFKKVRTAAQSGDYSPLEPLIRADAKLITAAGEQVGRETVLAQLKGMQQQRHRIQIVAPKGGLITVLIVPLSREDTLVGRGREQVYRVAEDQLIELTDLGRTPNMVYRPESQPN